MKSSGTIAPDSSDSVKLLCPETHPVAIGGGVDSGHLLNMVVTSSAPVVSTVATRNLFLESPIGYP